MRQVFTMGGQKFDTHEFIEKFQSEVSIVSYSSVLVFRSAQLFFTTPKKRCSTTNPVNQGGAKQ
jgi:hypothetical protein